MSFVRGQRTNYELNMKSQDIFILLKLISMRKSSSNQVGERGHDAGSLSARNLALLTGVGKTEVNASINRSLDVGLAKRSRKNKALSVNNKSLFEFIVYGIKYVFPARPAELVRGMPTAHGAPVLAKQLMSGSDSVLVWPDATASVMGQSIKPLYETVPMAAANDPKLYEFLALVDAIRVGGARESNLAVKLLDEAFKE